VSAEDGEEADGPRATLDLVGQDRALRQVGEMVASRRLPSAVLFTGPRGVGKATLAYRLARHLLAGEPPGANLELAPDHPTVARVRAGSEPDLLVLERASGPKAPKDISVDQVRGLVTRLRMTASGGGWRIGIVDSLDATNLNSANALLKIVEEPPPRTLLILIAHSLGAVLPTLRSRCRRVALTPLEPDDVATLLGRHLGALSAEHRAALAALSGGSPGRAMTLETVLGLPAAVEVLGAALDTIVGGRLPPDQFFDRLLTGDAAGRMPVLSELLGLLLTELARTAAFGGPRHTTSLPGIDAAAAAQAAGRRYAAGWAEVAGTVAELFAAGEAANLDRKQTLISVFTRLRSAAT